MKAQTNQRSNKK